MSSERVLPTCYRHADRETRLACSNCGRPVCVDCVRTAAVGQRCLECSAPDAGQRAMDMEDVRAPAASRAPITMAILTISVAIFAIELVVPALGDEIRSRFAQINELIALGEWWRLLTAAFLHGGLTHVAFNMYALYLFGPQLEHEVGSLSFTALYVASAVSGAAAYYVAEPTGIAVGASGAIFGLFGAWLAASYRGRHTVTGRASLRQLLVLLGINLALGFVPGTNIAWQAHLGGLVAGLLIASVWMLPHVRGRAVLRSAVALAVAVVALATVI